MDIETIRNLVVPIVGYDDLKRRLLVGELDRYQRSLEWIDRHPGGSLLDVGACGDLVPIYQSVLGYRRVVCLDMAGASGWHRLRHRDGAVYEFEARRVNLEKEPFPFADASFDQVVVMEAIEHLAIDPMFMLSEVNRVLKDGGRLLLTTPNITSLASLYRQLWSRHPAVGGQTYGPGIMDRHHREYTPQEVGAVLEAAGFDAGRLDTFDPTPPNASVRQVRRLLKMLRCFKPDINVELRGRVIRCAAVKVDGVVERFPEVIYPRFAYYDYAEYDRKLTERFGGRRYWRSSIHQDAPLDEETSDVREGTCVSA